MVSDAPDASSPTPANGDLTGVLPALARSETAERLVRETPERLSDEAVALIARARTGSTAAAFFDLDKTVLARSSTLALGRTMFRGGLLGPSALLKGLYAQMVYQLVGADEEKMERMRVALLELTKGWEVERVRHVVGEALEHVLAPLVYQEALDLFDEHRLAARDIWIVSSSGEEIVRPIAEHLGVRNVIATIAGVEDGHYDGTLHFYAYGPNKATAIHQVAEVRGYDLSESYAYSDSLTDLPMLSVVGHAVAVNPDKELRAAAKAMGWEVRDFTSPVSLRHRLGEIPRPPNEALAGVAVIAAAAAVGWLVLGRRRRTAA